MATTKLSIDRLIRSGHRTFTPSLWCYGFQISSFGTPEQADDVGGEARRVQ